jgi:hypothetical protein
MGALSKILLCIALGLAVVLICCGFSVEPFVALRAYSAGLNFSFALATSLFLAEHTKLQYGVGQFGRIALIATFVGLVFAVDVLLSLGGFKELESKRLQIVVFVYGSLLIVFWLNRYRKAFWK